MEKLRNLLVGAWAMAGRHLKALLLALAVVGIATAGSFAGSLSDWLGLSSKTDGLELSGDIEAHESLLSFKTVQSRIIYLPFDEGASVGKGTILARVDDSDYQQQVAIAEATLLTQQRALAAQRQSAVAAAETVTNDIADYQEKRIDAQRQEALWQKQATAAQTRDLAVTAFKQSAAALSRDRALQKVAERNVELAIANVKNAQASRDLAQIILGYTVLRAPFSGVVTVRQAELGEVVVPGTPVVTLTDLDHVWLRAYINETDIAKVRLGEPVLVTTDSYPGKVYHGRLSSIASEAEFTPKSVETHAERVTLVYRARIDLENPTHELVPGLPADAHIKFVPSGQT